MSEIIPAIIAKDFEDLKSKVKLVEPFVKTVQLDIMDGVFVPNETWPFAPLSGAQGKPSVSDLDDLETSVMLEAHLMIENPHQYLNEWLAGSVERVILHWEAMEKIHNHEILPYETQVGAYFPVSNLAQEIHEKGKQFGIALNLETPVTVLDHFISEIDMVLLMSVNPGFAGQKFQDSVLGKISALRQKYPDVKIGVDGGVSSQNIRDLVDAGANFLAVGSSIFASNNPAEEIRKLQNIIK